MIYYQTVINNKVEYCHHLIVEKALGRELKYPEEIHHWDGNPKNNDSTNLILCPDRAYHMLLEQRTRAFDACGNANWLKCQYCKQYDSPDNIYAGKSVNRHKECHRIYESKRYRLTNKG